MPNNDLGLMGAATSSGFNEGMQELLKERILRQKWAEELRKQQVDEAQRQQQLLLNQRNTTLGEQRFEEDNRRYGQQRKDQEAAAFGAGQEKQEAKRLVQLVLNDPETPPEVKRLFMLKAAGLGVGAVGVGDVRTGQERGAIATEEDARDLTKVKNETRARAEIEKEFRPPTQGPEPSYEWVIRDGKPLQIRKGQAQPGDTPYDAVAARGKPEGGGPSPYSSERHARVLQSVDDLTKRVGVMTAGFGSLLSSVPQSDARDFKAELDTLKSNIAFNELTEMREASKTGGALGQVSDRELNLLQSALGALDQGQSPENLKKNLAQIRSSIERWQQAVASGGSPTPEPTPGGAPSIEYVRDPKTGRLVRKTR